MSFEELRSEIKEKIRACKTQDELKALAKAEGWFRYQVVIRAPSTKDIVKAVKWIEAERPAPKELRIAFDVDAIDLA